MAPILATTNKAIARLLFSILTILVATSFQANTAHAAVNSEYFDAAYQPNATNQYLQQPTPKAAPKAKSSKVAQNTSNQTSIQQVCASGFNGQCQYRSGDAMGAQTTAPEEDNETPYTQQQLHQIFGVKVKGKDTLHNKTTAVASKSNPDIIILTTVETTKIVMPDGSGKIMSRCRDGSCSPYIKPLLDFGFLIGADGGLNSAQTATLNYGNLRIDTGTHELNDYSIGPSIGINTFVNVTDRFSVMLRLNGSAQFAVGGNYANNTNGTSGATSLGFLGGNATTQIGIGYDVGYWKQGRYRLGFYGGFEGGYGNWEKGFDAFGGSVPYAMNMLGAFGVTDGFFGVRSILNDEDGKGQWILEAYLNGGAALYQNPGGVTYSGDLGTINFDRKTSPTIGGSFNIERRKYLQSAPIYLGVFLKGNINTMAVAPNQNLQSASSLNAAIQSSYDQLATDLEDTGEIYQNSITNINKTMVSAQTTTTNLEQQMTGMYSQSLRSILSPAGTTGSMLDEITQTQTDITTFQTFVDTLPALYPTTQPDVTTIDTTVADMQTTLTDLVSQANAGVTLMNGIPTLATMATDAATVSTSNSQIAGYVTNITNDVTGITNNIGYIIAEFPADANGNHSLKSVVNAQNQLGYLNTSINTLNTQIGYLSSDVSKVYNDANDITQFADGNGGFSTCVGNSSFLSSLVCNGSNGTNTNYAVQLGTDIINMHNEMGTVNTDIQNVINAVSPLQNSLNEVQDAANAIYFQNGSSAPTGYIPNIQGYVADISNQLTDITNSLTPSNTANDALIDGITNLQDFWTDMEPTTAAMYADITDLKSDLATLNSSVTNIANILEADGAPSSTINTLQNDFTAVTTDINALYAQVSEISFMACIEAGTSSSACSSTVIMSDFNLLKNDINQLENEIHSLENGMTTQSQIINTDMTNLQAAIAKASSGGTQSDGVTGIFSFYIHGVFGMSIGATF